MPALASPPANVAARPLRASAGAGRGRAVVVIAALLLGACGAGEVDRPALSERAYLAWVKRDCLAGRQIVARAAGARALPAVYLRRIADGAAEIQRDFVGVRPPVGLRTVHRRLVAVGDAQLALIRSALKRLERGDAASAAAELEARNRELVRRANAIAQRLGVAECVNDPGGP